jgi:hypothetical protein
MIPLDVSQSPSVLQDLSHEDAQNPLPDVPVPPDDPTMPPPEPVPLDPEQLANHANASVTAKIVCETLVSFISPPREPRPAGPSSMGTRSRPLLLLVPE